MKFNLGLQGSRGPHRLINLKLFQAACHLVSPKVPPFPFSSVPSDRRSDLPIVRYRPSKLIITDLPRFLPRKISPHFRMIGANANPFRAPRPKLWPKTPFLPYLLIRPSKSSSEHTVVILASRLVVLKKKLSKNSTRSPRKVPEKPPF